MVHWIKEGKILNVKGRDFQTARRDADDKIIWEDKNSQTPALVNATVSDVLELVVLGIPAQVMTKQDTIHGTRLYSQMTDRNSHVPKGVIEIEDAEWDWVIKKMGDDKVGPSIFGMHLEAVESSLKVLEKEGEEARKKKNDAGAKKKKNGKPEGEEGTPTEQQE